MWLDTEVKGFKPKKSKYRRAEPTKKRGVGRLLLEVHPNNAKYFFFQYWRGGKKVVVSIGRFRGSKVETGLSLSEARETAREYGTLLQSGTDIKQYLEEQKQGETEKLKLQAARKRQGTFEQLLDSYIENMKAEGRRSHESVKRSLDTYVKTPYQQLIKKKAFDIESDDIRMILSIMLEKKITTHNIRVRSYLHAAFQHGLKQDNNPKNYQKDAVRFNLKLNPVAFVPRQAEYETVGEHVIPEKEIKIIWDEFKVTPVSEYLVKLSFTTGQRLGELVRLRREDINIKEKILTIPGTVSKNARVHIVPLTDLSLDIVKEALEFSEGCAYLFPAKTGRKISKLKHTSSSTTANKIAEYCEDNENVTKFIPRDIRRTVKTLMGKAGVPKELRDRLQNHALMDVSAKHYDRFDYAQEKKHGMEVWNNYLDLIIHPRKNVTRIGKKRA